MPENSTPEPEPFVDESSHAAEHSEPVLPHATEKSPDDQKPPLYVAGWGVMGQSTPDVATGSTPVTRRDD